MKNYFFLFFLILINYILVSSIIFFFSYFSLIKGKVYDWPVINDIQKSIYFKGGLRNIWQQKKDCVKFDKHLLYIPKKGACKFNNPEFKTYLNFSDGYRLNGNPKLPKLKKKDSILVLGDSLAMGWGVNDNETYSSLIEKKIGRKVYNQAVSSYGTVRQVKRYLNSELYNTDEIGTIIIHYHHNDLLENNNLKLSKTYNQSSFNKVIEENKINALWVIRQFKRSLRITYNALINLFFNNKKKLEIDLKEHFIKVENLIMNNLDITNKKFIFLYIIEKNTKVINLPLKSKLKNLDFVILEMENKNFFIIDDHINALGHINVSMELMKKIK